MTHALCAQVYDGLNDRFRAQAQAQEDAMIAQVQEDAMIAQVQEDAMIAQVQEDAMIA